MTQDDHGHHNTHVQTISLLGSYVPRRCGIATFTKDLHDALTHAMEEGKGGRVNVIAMDDALESYPYPGEVRFQIPAYQQRQYVTAAELLNINQIDVAIVQHEYGIYGGEDGSYVLNLLRRLRMPVITTLHTVLTEPTRGQRAVMRDLSRLSDRLVVMTHLAARLLREIYKVPEEKIVYIPHGIPDVPFVDTHYYKDQFSLEERQVLLTFGLLAPNKGIEVAINAMPRIVEKHPDAIYIILGATHPHILKQQGNAYRDSLERLVEQHGLDDHVKFHNRFVTIDELKGYIGAADIYVSPYPNAAQITSGTLAYATGAGKAVVSTPYWHAEELLAEGRGRLFPFNDSEQLAEQVNDLLGDELERNAIRKRAYVHCRSMVWTEVGKRYLEVAREVAAERSRKPRPVAFTHPDAAGKRALPELSLAHLRRMTDDTGIYQHAIYSIPDRNHGYCIDDNCRALVAVMMCYDLERDESVLPLADTYLSFLYHAFNPDNRRFRNFMAFDRSWLEDKGSDDSHARTIWSLGLAAALAPSDAMLAFATRLFHQSLDAIEDFTYKRSWAFALVGLHAYLSRFSGDTHVRRLRNQTAENLHKAFAEHSASDWPWCEELVTYDNAKLPHALILAGQWIPDKAMLDQGLRSLEWLLDLQVDEHKNVSLIGNDGWMQRGGVRARFDQQPIEAMALIEACAEAYRATQDSKWIDRARHVLGWFTGNNDTRSMLYNYQSGGCRDGLHADGPNLNEGAESTLAWLISLLTVMWLNRAEALVVAETPDDGEASPTDAPPPETAASTADKT